MNEFDVSLLDLPNEILLMILKKLNNTDVLYSLLNINHGRLETLAQEHVFSGTLNFVSFDPTSSMDRLRLDRFRIHILPSIYENVKYLILKPDLIECILLASHYPNLTKIKLCDFNEECALHYFGDESPLRYIFQHQITNLILVNHDKEMLIKSLKTYILNVYTQILNIFQNLKHLSIIGSSNMSTPCLALRGLPSNTFCSSSLTYLSIDVYSLDDCLYLLDGRLEQLATLIVRIGYMENSSSIVHNMDHLPNLKCFSLTFQNCITLLNTNFLLLFRRMSNLENLTLYLRIKDQDKFVDGTFLQSEILAYMPLLHSFTFYICTYVTTIDSLHHPTSQDVQRTFTNLGQKQVVCIINNISPEDIVCSVFSTPFTFDYIEDFGHTIPNIIFNHVTYLMIHDIVSFNREFFIELARAFPLLQTLRVLNMGAEPCQLNNSQSYKIAEFPHLTYLDMRRANSPYLEQFLNETKTYLPSLTKLNVIYNNLRIVTDNFTRRETRRNCAKVEQVLVSSPLAHTKDFYLHFPLL